MFNSPRIADLVPKTFLVWGLIAVAGAALIAGLVTLHLFMPQMAAHTTDGAIAAFNLDDEGSLGTWLSSFMLTIAAMLALVVYGVRKQKADDYHGRYRIWLWAAACWLVMSIDETGSLHEGFKELMVIATGKRLMGDGSIWWVMPYSLVLGGVGIRLLMDLRKARVAAACFIAAGTCFVAAVLTQMDFVVKHALLQSIALEEGLEMAGDLFLLLSMGLAARHMILDAQGLLSVKKKAAKKSAGEAVEKKPLSEGRKAAIHAAHTSLSGPKQGDYSSSRNRDAARSGQSSSRYDDDEEDDEDGDRKISRAERKAMRRMRRDER